MFSAKNRFKIIWRGKGFRIAHMGNIYMEDLIEYLTEFEKEIDV